MTRLLVASAVPFTVVGLSLVMARLQRPRDPWKQLARDSRKAARR